MLKRVVIAGVISSFCSFLCISGKREELRHLNQATQPGCLLFSPAHVLSFKELLKHSGVSPTGTEDQVSASSFLFSVPCVY